MHSVVKSISLPTGVTLPYVEQGDPSGTPMILLHGVTDSWRSFEEVLAHLPATVHAFAVTQRGHRGASRPEEGYRPRDFAADVAAFVEAKGLAPVVVVGHSMGSIVAQRLAHDRPEVVRGLVLVGATATPGRNAEVDGYWESTVSKLEDPIDPVVARDFQVSTIAQPVGEEWLEMVTRESLAVPARVWRAAFEGLLEEDLTREPGRVACPTLLLWGDRDAFFGRADQDAIMAATPQARLEVYEGTGHALHWEEPERFVMDVVAFAASLAERTVSTRG